MFAALAAIRLPLRAEMPAEEPAKLPASPQLGGCHNVVRRDNGANWQLRLQVQFMLPK